MKAIIESDTLIKKNYKLLLSVVGVGFVVAVTTIVLTENFTSFTNPRKYACYIAIAPFPYNILSLLPICMTEVKAGRG